MEQFSLEKYLKNPRRKITTRYGNRKVRLICTDRKAKLPIVALMVDMDGNEYVTYHTKNGWCSEEEKYPDKRDLFFADEEEELTEFEEGLNYFLRDWIQRKEDYRTIEEATKESSKKLLELARKELQPEFDKEMDKMFAETDKVIYQKGQQDALKSLPRWRNINQIQAENHYAHIANGIISPSGYFISYDDLETLPKEEL